MMHISCKEIYPQQTVYITFSMWMKAMPTQTIEDGKSDGIISELLGNIVVTTCVSVVKGHSEDSEECPGFIYR